MYKGVHNTNNRSPLGFISYKIKGPSYTRVYTVHDYYLLCLAIRNCIFRITNRNNIEIKQTILKYGFKKHNPMNTWSLAGQKLIYYNSVHLLCDISVRNILFQDMWQAQLLHLPISNRMHCCSDNLSAQIGKRLYLFSTFCIAFPQLVHVLRHLNVTVKVSILVVSAAYDVYSIRNTMYMDRKLDENARDF